MLPDVLNIHKLNKYLLLISLKENLIAGGGGGSKKFWVHLGVILLINTISTISIRFWDGVVVGKLGLWLQNKAFINNDAIRVAPISDWSSLMLIWGVVSQNYIWAKLLKTGFTMGASTV